MSVSMQQARDGIIRYIDSEILTKLSGAARVGAMVYISLAADGAVRMIHQHADDTAVKMLCIADENGMLDTDRMRDAVLEAMNGQRVEFRLPVIGNMVFDRGDAERLFEYIDGKM